MCRHVYVHCACMYEQIAPEDRQSLCIYWTLQSNIHFLHQKILHCLKTIDKYRNLHALFCACTRMHACKLCFRSEQIIVSIHWTLPSNFHFLLHSQIWHCLKTIAKYRKMHAPLCSLNHKYCSRSAKIIECIHWTLLSNFIFFIIPKSCTV